MHDEEKSLRPIHRVISIAIGIIVGLLISHYIPSLPLWRLAAHSGCNYYGVFPESNADHGTTLQEVMLGISTEEYEHAAFFWDDVKICERTDYNESLVSMDATIDLDLDQDHLTMLHNHPKDAVFSYVDLNSYCEFNCRRAIVVTRDKAYMIQAPNGWPSSEQLANYFVQHFGINFTDRENPGDYNDFLAMRDQGYVDLEVRDTGLEATFTPSAHFEIADYFELVFTEEPLSAILNDTSSLTLQSSCWSYFCRQKFPAESEFQLFML